MCAKVTLCVAVLIMAGCASVRLPEAGNTHPSSPAAAEAAEPKVSEILRIEQPAESSSPVAEKPVTSVNGGHRHEAGKIKTPLETLYTCPMHPEVVSKEPGKCPKCGMTLVPRKLSGEAK